jgi:hypothetical protein
MNSISVLAAGAGLLALGGCVTVPQGPTVMVMPGAGKSFEVFQADMGACRQFAQVSISGPTEAAQNNAGANVAGSAVAGAAVGALLGAATGNASAGAAWGAGTGVLVGSTAAGGSGAVSSYTLQRQYDIAYMQCMYAHGNQIPSYSAQRGSRAHSAPPQSRYGAPPPYAMTPPPNTPAPPGYASPAGYGVPPNAATPPPNTPAPPGVAASGSN